MKITAITSGTCYDCSWTPLILPDGMDIEAEKKLWRTWYDEKYCPGLDKRGMKVKYVSFTDYLVTRGAREPNESELVVWENY